MSPIEVEQINICMHLCKYLSKNCIIKISVNFQSDPYALYHFGTVTSSSYCYFTKHG